MSRITLAKTAGFCFGVARALDTCNALLDSGEKIVTLGPIIHNANVIRSLEDRGVGIVNSPSEVPAGYTMVIRSHGVPDSVYEECTRLGIKVADATCPFVAKIHSIVGKENTGRKDVLICGDAKHPEVEGILGSCAGRSMVFSTKEELETIISSKSMTNPLIMVAQTTFNLLQYKEFSNIAEEGFSDIDVRNTICNATAERQSEAEELARDSDVCFVIGDRHSSNTKKLFDVCAKHCKVYLLENIHDLRFDMYKGAQRIGITAGASTPKAIIEEVFVRMSETTKIEGIGVEEIDFAQAVEESIPVIRRNARVMGIVTEVKQNEVIVDIGAKQTGVVPFDEFTDDSSADLADLCKKGDELALVVIKVNDQEGITTLSKKRADSQEGIALVEKAAKEGTPIEAYVSEIVSKGLIAKVKGVNLFVPASQATLRRGEPFDGLLHQNIMVKVIEFDPRKHRAIASIREILQAEAEKKREELWNNIEVDKEYEGTVKSLTNYGAFVDIGGCDGMVHVSELSWQRIRHPSEVVKVGDVIKVFVKELDREKGRISLGYKRDEENPWTIFSTQYKIGDVFDATVVSLTKFGAFVRILPGVDGLVHISEISTERLNEPGEALSVGDTVKVKLIGIDEERNRVSLSIKAALSEEEMEEFNAKIAEKKAIIAERKAKKAAKAAEKAAAEAEKAAEQDAAPEAEPAAEPAPEAAPAEEVKAEE